MNLNTIEKNAVLFHTPYCDFTVTDDKNNKLCFDIMESPEKEPEVYIDNDADQILPVRCCAGKTLRIYTKDLELKKNYYINPSVQLIFRDTDERLFTDSISGDDYTFAVSFPDPNDELKYEPNYTENDFKFYNIERSGKNYTLRLYDKRNEYIDIFTFWIWNIKHHMSDYESSCEVATWWCP